MAIHEIAGDHDQVRGERVDATNHGLGELLSDQRSDMDIGEVRDRVGGDRQTVEGNADLPHDRSARDVEHAGDDDDTRRANAHQGCPPDIGAERHRDVTRHGTEK